MTEDGVRNLFGDQVVLKQDVSPLHRVVEDVEEVLTIGRLDALAEDHPLNVFVELPIHPVLQVVAPGKDDPVIFGQLNTGLLDGIDAGRGLIPVVVNEIAVPRFPERQYFEENEIADEGIGDVRVVEGLVRVLDRFRVDSLSARGVVLDLDGEVAADALDEHSVLDRDVGVFARDLIVAGRGGPLKIVLRGQRELDVSTVIDVGQRVVLLDVEAEYLLVVDGLSGLEEEQEPSR